MKQILSRINKLNDGSWQHLIVGYTLKLIVGILILVIAFWIINLVVKHVNQFFIKRNIGNNVDGFIKTMVGTGLKILVIISVLNLVGVRTTSIVAIVGAIGLAIGLALQGTLTNFAGGVMLLLFRPFKPGDTIEAQGKKGMVKEIQVFCTLLETTESKIIIIPNSILSNGIVENYGRIKAEVS